MFFNEITGYFCMSLSEFLANRLKFVFCGNMGSGGRSYFNFHAEHLVLMGMSLENMCVGS